MVDRAVLAYLKEHAGASNAALARRAFVTPQTMHAILVTLEKSGHIVRSPHPDHGRLQRTELTTSGRLALNAASKIAMDAEARLKTAAEPLEPSAAAALLLRLAQALR